MKTIEETFDMHCLELCVKGRIENYEVSEDKTIKALLKECKRKLPRAKYQGLKTKYHEART